VTLLIWLTRLFTFTTRCWFTLLRLRLFTLLPLRYWRFGCWRCVTVDWFGYVVVGVVLRLLHLRLHSPFRWTLICCSPVDPIYGCCCYGSVYGSHVPFADVDSVTLFYTLLICYVGVTDVYVVDLHTLLFVAICWFTLLLRCCCCCCCCWCPFTTFMRCYVYDLLLLRVTVPFDSLLLICCCCCCLRCCRYVPTLLLRYVTRLLLRCDLRCCCCYVTTFVTRLFVADLPVDLRCYVDLLIDLLPLIVVVTFTGPRCYVTIWLRSGVFTLFVVVTLLFVVDLLLRCCCWPRCWFVVVGVVVDVVVWFVVVDLLLWYLFVTLLLLLLLRCCCTTLLRLPRSRWFTFVVVVSLRFTLLVLLLRCCWVDVPPLPFTFTLLRCCYVGLPGVVAVAICCCCCYCWFTLLLLRCYLLHVWFVVTICYVVTFTLLIAIYVPVYDLLLLLFDFVRLITVVVVVGRYVVYVAVYTFTLLVLRLRYVVTLLRVYSVVVYRCVTLLRCYVGYDLLLRCWLLLRCGYVYYVYVYRYRVYRLFVVVTLPFVDLFPDVVVDLLLLRWVVVDLDYDWNVWFPVVGYYVDPVGRYRLLFRLRLRCSYVTFGWPRCGCWLFDFTRLYIYVWFVVTLRLRCCHTTFTVGYVTFRLIYDCGWLLRWFTFTFTVVVDLRYGYIGRSRLLRFTGCWVVAFYVYVYVTFTLIYVYVYVVTVHTILRLRSRCRWILHVLVDSHTVTVPRCSHVVTLHFTFVYDYGWLRWFVVVYVTDSRCSTTRLRTLLVTHGTFTRSHTGVVGGRLRLVVRWFALLRYVGWFDLRYRLPTFDFVLLLLRCYVTFPVCCWLRWLRLRCLFPVIPVYVVDHVDLRSRYLLLIRFTTRCSGSRLVYTRLLRWICSRSFPDCDSVCLFPVTLRCSHTHTVTFTFTFTVTFTLLRWRCWWLHVYVYTLLRSFPLLDVGCYVGLRLRLRLPVIYLHVTFGLLITVTFTHVYVVDSFVDLLRYVTLRFTHVTLRCWTTFDLWFTLLWLHVTTHVCCSGCCGYVVRSTRSRLRTYVWFTFTLLLHLRWFLRWLLLPFTLRSRCCLHVARCWFVVCVCYTRCCWFVVVVIYVPVYVVRLHVYTHHVVVTHLRLLRCCCWCVYTHTIYTLFVDFTHVGYVDCIYVLPVGCYVTLRLIYVGYLRCCCCCSFTHLQLRCCRCCWLLLLLLIPVQLLRLYTFTLIGVVTGWFVPCLRCYVPVYVGRSFVTRWIAVCCSGCYHDFVTFGYICWFTIYWRWFYGLHVAVRTLLLRLFTFTFTVVGLHVCLRLRLRICYVCCTLRLRLRLLRFTFTFTRSLRLLLLLVTLPVVTVTFTRLRSHYAFDLFGYVPTHLRCRYALFVVGYTLLRYGWFDSHTFDLRCSVTPRSRLRYVAGGWFYGLHLRLIYIYVTFYTFYVVTVTLLIVPTRLRSLRYVTFPFTTFTLRVVGYGYVHVVVVTRCVTRCVYVYVRLRLIWFLVTDLPVLILRCSVTLPTPRSRFHVHHVVVVPHTRVVSPHRLYTFSRLRLFGYVVTLHHGYVTLRLPFTVYVTVVYTVICTVTVTHVTFTVGYVALRYVVTVTFVVIWLIWLRSPRLIYVALRGYVTLRFDFTFPVCCSHVLRWTRLIYTRCCYSPFTFTLHYVCYRCWLDDYVDVTFTFDLHTLISLDAIWFTRYVVVGCPLLRYVVVVVVVPFVVTIWFTLPFDSRCSHVYVWLRLLFPICWFATRLHTTRLLRCSHVVVTLDPICWLRYDLFTLLLRWFVVTLLVYVDLLLIDLRCYVTLLRYVTLLLRLFTFTVVITFTLVDLRYVTVFTFTFTFVDLLICCVVVRCCYVAGPTLLRYYVDLRYVFGYVGRTLICWLLRCWRTFTVYLRCCCCYVGLIYTHYRWLRYPGYVGCSLPVALRFTFDSVVRCWLLLNVTFYGYVCWCSVAFTFTFVVVVVVITVTICGYDLRIYVYVYVPRYGFGLRLRFATTRLRFGYGYGTHGCYVTLLRLLISLIRLIRWFVPRLRLRCVVVVTRCYVWTRLPVTFTFVWLRLRFTRWFTFDLRLRFTFTFGYVYLRRWFIYVCTRLVVHGWIRTVTRTPPVYRLRYVVAFTTHHTFAFTVGFTHYTRYVYVTTLFYTTFTHTTFAFTLVDFTFTARLPHVTRVCYRLRCGCTVYVYVWLPRLVVYGYGYLCVYTFTFTFGYRYGYVLYVPHVYGYGYVDLRLVVVDLRWTLLQVDYLITFTVVPVCWCWLRLLIAGYRYVTLFTIYHLFTLLHDFTWRYTFTFTFVVVTLLLRYVAFTLLLHTFVWRYVCYVCIYVVTDVTFDVVVYVTFVALYVTGWLPVCYVADLDVTLLFTTFVDLFCYDLRSICHGYHTFTRLFTLLRSRYVTRYVVTDVRLVPGWVVALYIYVVTTHGRSHLFTVPRLLFWLNPVVTRLLTTRSLLPHVYVPHGYVTLHRLIPFTFYYARYVTGRYVYGYVGLLDVVDCLRWLLRLFRFTFTLHVTLLHTTFTFGFCSRLLVVTFDLHLFTGLLRLFGWILHVDSLIYVTFGWFPGRLRSRGYVYVAVVYVVTFPVTGSRCYVPVTLVTVDFTFTPTFVCGYLRLRCWFTARYILHVGLPTFRLPVTRLLIPGWFPFRSRLLVGCCCLVYTHRFTRLPFTHVTFTRLHGWLVHTFTHTRLRWFTFTTRPVHTRLLRLTFGFPVGYVRSHTHVPFWLVTHWLRYGYHTDVTFTVGYTVTTFALRLPTFTFYVVGCWVTVTAHVVTVTLFPFVVAVAFVTLIAVVTLLDITHCSRFVVRYVVPVDLIPGYDLICCWLLLVMLLLVIAVDLVDCYDLRCCVVDIDCCCWRWMIVRYPLLLLIWLRWLLTLLVVDLLCCCLRNVVTHFTLRFPGWFTLHSYTLHTILRLFPLVTLRFTLRLRLPVTFTFVTGCYVYGYVTFGWICCYVTVTFVYGCLRCVYVCYVTLVGCLLIWFVTLVDRLIYTFDLRLRLVDVWLLLPDLRSVYVTTHRCSDFPRLFVRYDCRYVWLRLIWLLRLRYAILLFVVGIYVTFGWFVVRLLVVTLLRLVTIWFYVTVTVATRWLRYVCLIYVCPLRLVVTVVTLRWRLRLRCYVILFTLRYVWLRFTFTLRCSPRCWVGRLRYVTLHIVPGYYVLRLYVGCYVYVTFPRWLRWLRWFTLRLRLRWAHGYVTRYGYRFPTPRWRYSHVYVTRYGYVTFDLVILVRFGCCWFTFVTFVGGRLRLRLRTFYVCFTLRLRLLVTHHVRLRLPRLRLLRLRYTHDTLYTFYTFTRLRLRLQLRLHVHRLRLIYVVQILHVAPVTHTFPLRLRCAVARLLRLRCCCCTHTVGLLRYVTFIYTLIALRLVLTFVTVQLICTRWTLLRFVVYVTIYVPVTLPVGYVVTAFVTFTFVTLRTLRLIYVLHVCYVVAVYGYTHVYTRLVTVTHGLPHHHGLRFTGLVTTFYTTFTLPVTRLDTILTLFRLVYARLFTFTLICCVCYGYVYGLIRVPVDLLHGCLLHVYVGWLTPFVGCLRCWLHVYTFAVTFTTVALRTFTVVLLLLLLLIALLLIYRWFGVEFYVTLLRLFTICYVYVYVYIYTFVVVTFVTGLLRYVAFTFVCWVVVPVVVILPPRLRCWVDVVVVVGALPFIYVRWLRWLLRCCSHLIYHATLRLFDCCWCLRCYVGVTFPVYVWFGCLRFTRLRYGFYVYGYGLDYTFTHVLRYVWFGCLRWLKKRLRLLFTFAPFGLPFPVAVYVTFPVWFTFTFDYGSRFTFPRLIPVVYLLPTRLLRLRSTRYLYGYVTFVVRLIHVPVYVCYVLTLVTGHLRLQLRLRLRLFDLVTFGCVYRWVTLPHTFAVTVGWLFTLLVPVPTLRFGLVTVGLPHTPFGYVLFTVAGYGCVTFTFTHGYGCCCCCLRLRHVTLRLLVTFGCVYVVVYVTFRLHVCGYAHVLPHTLRVCSRSLHVTTLLPFPGGPPPPPHGYTRSPFTLQIWTLHTHTVCYGRCCVYGRYVCVYVVVTDVYGTRFTLLVTFVTRLRFTFTRFALILPTDTHRLLVTHTRLILRTLFVTTLRLVTLRWLLILRLRVCYVVVTLLRYVAVYTFHVVTFTLLPRITVGYGWFPFTTWTIYPVVVPGCYVTHTVTLHGWFPVYVGSPRYILRWIADVTFDLRCYVWVEHTFTRSVYTVTLVTFPHVWFGFVVTVCTFGYVYAFTLRFGRLRYVAVPFTIHV